VVKLFVSGPQASQTRQYVQQQQSEAPTLELKAIKLDETAKAVESSDKVTNAVSVGDNAVADKTFANVAIAAEDSNLEAPSQF
jgi:hypothetical protein